MINENAPRRALARNHRLRTVRACSQRLAAPQQAARVGAALGGRSKPAREDYLHDCTHDCAGKQQGRTVMVPLHMWRGLVVGRWQSRARLTLSFARSIAALARAVCESASRSCEVGEGEVGEGDVSARRDGRGVVPVRCTVTVTPE